MKIFKHRVQIPSFIISMVIISLSFGSCKKACEDELTFTKCVTNSTIQTVEFKVGNIDSVTLEPNERYCVDLPEGIFPWTATNDKFQFSGDFDIRKCERNLEIFLSLNFLTTDFRDSLIGSYLLDSCVFTIDSAGFIKEKFVSDSIPGSINIEDISETARITFQNSDLVKVLGSSPMFTFQNIESNPTISATYNETINRIEYVRLLVNNRGENETCICVGKRL